MAAGVTALPPLGSTEWRDASIRGIVAVAALGGGFCYLVIFGGIMIMRAALRPRSRDAPPGSDPGGEPPTSA